MNKYFPPSELPINDDGSCFHLHLKPEQLADRVILVGDPGRVSMVASHFDSIEAEVQSREFHTITGLYTPHNSAAAIGSCPTKRITVQSTGIGCDNIDIVMTELDALANIDFNTRTEKDTFRQLTIVRIGTCGGIQPDTPIGTFIASVKSIGFDGLLNYYAGRDNVCDLDLEEAFKRHMNWSPLKGAPYVATANPSLIDQIAGTPAIYPQDQLMKRGITIACGGFYGPQGRQIRIPIQDPEQNAKVESFRYSTSKSNSSNACESTITNITNDSASELKVCNFEMESSALAGLSALLGHRAMTCCMVIANRYNNEMNTNYKSSIDDLIQTVLDRI